MNNKKTSTNINDSSKEDSQHTQDDDMKNDNEKITLDDESSDKLSEKDMQNGDGNNEEKKSTATIDNEDDCSVPEELEEEEEEVVEKEQEDSTDKIIPSEKKEDIQEPLETDKSREPNHLSQHGVEGVNSTPIYTPTPPKPPKHLEVSTSIYTFTNIPYTCNHGPLYYYTTHVHTYYYNLVSCSIIHIHTIS